MIEIEVFATENPYRSNTVMARNFTCPEEETVHIRLDPDRGFATEKNYDWLTIIYPSYFKGVVDKEKRTMCFTLASTILN